jgi:N-acetylglutamate synthase-like GNAT family acetyltransferase
MTFQGIIRRCDEGDFEVVWTIINDGAQAYEGVIPSDRWKIPYLSKRKLCEEIDDGVAFWGYEEEGKLIGVMGIQHVEDVTLIRHAYVRPERQGEGIGSRLLTRLRSQTDRPILIGTWADAVWAIRFYEKHGFQMVSADEKTRLLRRYWAIPGRQVETSVVLGDQTWFDVRDSSSRESG